MNVRFYRNLVILFFCCVSLNGCIHFVIAKVMLDIVSIYKINTLEKDVKKLKLDALRKKE